MKEGNLKNLIEMVSNMKKKSRADKSKARPINPIYFFSLEMLKFM